VSASVRYDALVVASAPRCAGGHFRRGGQRQRRRQLLCVQQIARRASCAATASRAARACATRCVTHRTRHILSKSQLLLHH
jgi:hypothetical protein